MQSPTRESFLLYKSFYEPIRGLSDDELGILFRIVFEYQINPDIPVGFEVPNSVHMAFEFIKNQFRLDAKKYEKIVERNQQNGLKGGRPKGSQQSKTPKPKKPSGISGNPTKPKKADNENGNDNENDKDTTNVVIRPVEKVVGHYNKVFGKSITSFAGFEANFDHWLKVHPLEKMLRAIDNAKKDTFWKDNLTLTILFRQRNPNKENVDWIEDFANRTGGAPSQEAIEEKNRKALESQAAEDRKVEVGKIKQRFDNDHFDRKYGAGKWQRWQFPKNSGLYVLTEGDRKRAWVEFSEAFPAEAAEISEISEGK